MTKRKELIRQLEQMYIEHAEAESDLRSLIASLPHDGGPLESLEEYNRKRNQEQLSWCDAEA